MDKNLVRFVWTYGKWDTIKTLIVICLMFPVIYISLEIPKIIVNKALGAGNTPVEFPIEFLFVEMDNLTYLVSLCIIFITMIVLNNWLKYVQNVQVGLTSERMLRRLRYHLYENVLRFRIKRFQHMKQGEIVQSVMGEVEPLGGFFGEVISTPLREGGLLAVYMTFIFLQDPFLGAAAIALYPIQGYIIPKLQKRVVMLNKKRVANVRKIADNLGESVGAIEEIHANDTARWHLAQVADKLYENFSIRLDIFKRKYLIKGLNNFMIALTPFAFYLFGGIQVINGNLEIGSLVAVLAAYKDVAGPWKALLNYFQRWTDLNSRFELVVENFTVEGLVYDRERVYDENPTPLKGDVEIKNVSFGPGSSGLNGASCTAPYGSFTGVLGGDEGGRELIMKMMVGLVEPEGGRVTIGGTQVTEATMPAVGDAVAFVSGDNAFFAGSLRDNLTYSLRKNASMLSASEAEDAANKLKEAQITGNFAADPMGDWTDYEAAHVANAAELDARIVELASKVGLADELYSLGLQSRIDPADHPEIAEKIADARNTLRDAAAQNRELADLVEFWDDDAFNQNASLLENVLYAMPKKARASIADYAEDEDVVAILAESGAEQPLISAGLSIAEQLVELLGAVDEDSSLLDSFSDYSKKDILASAEVVEKFRMKSDHKPSDEEKRLLLSFALAFVPVRDRLDAVDDEVEAQLLAARAKAIQLTQNSDKFVSFGEDVYSPALSLSENLLHGKRRYDRRSAWKKFDDFLEDEIERSGLREGITAVGLGAQLGAGGAGLSASSKKRSALIRALLKRPEMIVIDGVAASASPEDAAIRRSILEEMDGKTVVMSLTSEDAAQDCDHLIIVSDDGTAKDGASGSKAEPVS